MPPDPARALAAEKLLDRGYGKPPQLNTADAGLFRRARDMSDDELAAIIQRAPPMLALQALPVRSLSSLIAAPASAAEPGQRKRVAPINALA